MARVTSDAGQTEAERLARDVTDLHRRRDEGHAFYAVLMAISGQGATASILTDLAGYARDLLRADAAAVDLDARTAASIRFETPEGPTFGVGGVPAPGASRAEQEVHGTTGRLGTLWVTRAEPFTDRDRSFLANLAGLAGIALTNARVREQDRQREVLAERTRIARELHDSMAQVLGALHLRLRMLETFPSVAGDPDAAAEVAAMAHLADEAYRDVREAILGLRSADREHLTLEQQLAAHIAAFGEQTGITTTFHNDTGGPIRLSPRAEVHLVRVVQEALTNVRKHAGAGHATVTVTAAEGSTVFTIADDGRGFEVPEGAPSSDGYGLFTMRDRLSLLHGTLAVESAPGAGTRVVATVPEPPAPPESRN